MLHGNINTMLKLFSLLIWSSLFFGGFASRASNKTNARTTPITCFVWSARIVCVSINVCKWKFKSTLDERKKDTHNAHSCRGKTDIFTKLECACSHRVLESLSGWCSALPPPHLHCVNDGTSFEQTNINWKRNFLTMRYDALTQFHSFIQYSNVLNHILPSECWVTKNTFET